MGIMSLIKTLFLLADNSLSPAPPLLLRSSSMRYPLRIGLVGDLGQSRNASVTLKHLNAHRPDVLINVGDISYADLYQPNVGLPNVRPLLNPLSMWTLCTPMLPHQDTVHFMTSNKLGSNHRRWDASAVLYENLTSRVPMLSCPGNHEIGAGLLGSHLIGVQQ